MPQQRRNLPPGRMRELSALIMLHSGRYPLIHDPEGEFNLWIRQNYRFFYASMCNQSNDGEFIKIRYSGGGSVTKTHTTNYWASTCKQ